MKTKTRAVLWALFIMYCAVMLWLLIGQRIGRSAYVFDYWEQVRMSLNLVPLRTIREFIEALRVGETVEGYSRRFAFVNLAGNVLLFVPLGLFLPALWPRLRSYLPFILCTALAVISVELIQLFGLLGSCDVDDLILNLLGASMGFGLYKLGAGLFYKSRQ